VTYPSPGTLIPMDAEIDLNSDVGESFGRWRIGDDEAVLALVDQRPTWPAASTPATRARLRRTCEVAAERGVVVGAQVG